MSGTSPEWAKSEEEKQDHQSLNKQKKKRERIPYEPRFVQKGNLRYQIDENGERLSPFPRGVTYLDRVRPGNRKFVKKALEMKGSNHINWVK